MKSLLYNDLISWECGFFFRTFQYQNILEVSKYMRGLQIYENPWILKIERTLKGHLIHFLIHVPK